MITLTSAHQALLNSREYSPYDLYDWTFLDGTHLRLCGNGRTVTWNGQTYAGDGVASLERGDLRISRGLDADTLTITIRPGEDDTLLGIPWQQACNNGAFDGAQLSVYRGHAAKAGGDIVGAVLRFKGPVDEISGDLNIEMKVKSFTSILDRQFPLHVYQAGCCRTVYDAGCTLSRTTYQVSGSLLAGSTDQILQTGLTQADGWFASGEIRFTGGENAGARRTVKKHASGALTLAYPLIFDPTAGDTFVIWAGCDGQYSTCTGKFNNGAHFSGEPVIPSPETSY